MTESSNISKVHPGSPKELIAIVGRAILPAAGFSAGTSGGQREIRAA
jgi:hypothetical protein